MSRRAMLRAVLAMSFGGALSHRARAQPLAGQTVKLVVPYPAGGSMDLIGRLIAEPMGHSLGATVIVDNRPGAAGQVASAGVARATPDGTTLLLTNPGPAAVAFALNPRLSYNPLHDFSPISLAAVSPMLISTGAAAPYRKLGDLVAAATAAPGRLNFATTGSGSLSHVVLEAFNASAGIRATHIPYKGGAEISMAAIAGDVDYFVSAPSDVIGLLRSGKLRALAVTSTSRSSLMPDVPTVAESGPVGFEVVYWVALVAPARTPPGVVAALQQAVRVAAEEPAVREKMAGAMAQATSSSSLQLQGMIESDVSRWRRVVQAAGIKVE